MPEAAPLATVHVSRGHLCPARPSCFSFSEYTKTLLTLRPAFSLVTVILGQHEWVLGCPDIWLNLILEVSVESAFWDEINVCTPTQ